MPNNCNRGDIPISACKAFSVSTCCSSISSESSLSASSSSILILISSIFCVAELARRQRAWKSSYLAEHEVSFRKLHEHLFCTERVVELFFEFVDLFVGGLETGEGHFVLGCESMSDPLGRERGKRRGVPCRSSTPASSRSSSMI